MSRISKYWDEYKGRHSLKHFQSPAQNKYQAGLVEFQLAQTAKAADLSERCSTDIEILKGRFSSSEDQILGLIKLASLQQQQALSQESELASIKKLLAAGRVSELPQKQRVPKAVSSEALRNEKHELVRRIADCEANMKEVHALLITTSEQVKRAPSLAHLEARVNFSVRSALDKLGQQIKGYVQDQETIRRTLEELSERIVGATLCSTDRVLKRGSSVSSGSSIFERTIKKPVLKKKAKKKALKKTKKVPIKNKH